MNKGVNIDMFHHLRDAVRMKHPEKWRTKQFISPSEQCSNTLVGFGQGFLSSVQCDNTGASLEPPGLAPAVHLFLQLKSALKGQCFCDAADIMKNARQS